MNNTNNIDNNDTNKLNFHYVKHAFAWCDKSHFFYIIINVMSSNIIRRYTKQ